LDQEFRNFEQHVKLIFQGPLRKESGESKAAYLQIWLGSQGRAIIESWGLDDNDKTTDNICERFRQYFQPRKNVIFSRFLFRERKQQIGESTDSYVTVLRNLVKDCGYDALADEMVRDQIVVGITSPELRERLLLEGDSLTLKSAMEMVVTVEATKKQLATMAVGSTVDAVKTGGGDHSHKRGDGQQRTFLCKFCARRHGKKQCPAYGKECHNCKKMHHFATCCKKRGTGVHEVNDEEEEEGHKIDVIADNDRPNTAYANIELNTADTVRFKLDTGAQVNVIPKATYLKLTKRPEMKKTTQKFYGYAGQAIDIQGSVELSCKYKGKSYKGTFFIANTKGHSQPILGLQACMDLGIVTLVLSVESQGRSSPLTRDAVISEYGHLFSGLGGLDGEIMVRLKDGAVPVVHPPRRVPHALKEKLKEELQSMEDQGVIAKVTEPTDWVNSLVVVEKPNGKLRVCIDPKNLNKAIKRPYYPTPTLEDVLSKMSGAKHFSKLDARSGYWQLKLSDESSYLTTFNTPFGRYRFRRLPFGLISAQDEFQRKMDETFEGLPGVVPLVDDVIIWGKTREEHDMHLRAALDRASERNLRLNPDKLVVGATEVDYFGHVISADGLKPDPAKVKAVQEMAPPVDKKELQTMIGMINYLAKFAPQLSETIKPMRDLLKEDVEFRWDHPQEEALKKAKQVILSQPVLVYFDPSKPITLQVDASKYGLGAALLQEGKPVAFASKSLNATEENYAQIEKELYAILFGCRRFHQYLYGHQVTVQSDHKPLESIMKKPLSVAPPRLQRMLLQLQKYDIEVVHVPGKDIPVADALSRKFLPAQDDDEFVKELSAQVHCVMSSLPVTDNKMKQLQEATEKDPQMQDLQSAIQDGWPNERQRCKASIAEFWNFRDELSVIDGIIFKGSRILVPTALRPEMIDKVHSSHMGAEKTKQRARDTLFWPGMAKDIDSKVATCQVCATTRASNPKEPLLPHEIPTRPWQKVATDIFTWEKRQFLVTVDYYSRYFEVDELTTTTTTAVVRKLSAHFARHGIPEILISDNGPQFTSEQFAEFAAEWDFKHVTSSPNYPQSNGLAEKTVQTVKNIMTKSKADGKKPLLAILEYRNTPVDNLASPAKLLMGRQLRSVIPTSPQHLKPSTVSPDTVISRRKQMQAKQKKHYDKTARPLNPLKPGDKVYFQHAKGEKWTPATIVGMADTPRSYILKTTDATYRRNRRFIRVEK
jgi:transposase InsO family protein